MLLIASILKIKNLKTMFCNCFNKNKFLSVKVIITKKSWQILNDGEKLWLKLFEIHHNINWLYILDHPYRSLNMVQN